MLQSLGAALLPAVQVRIVLIVNHVLSREPQAAERLRAHAGRQLRIEATGLPAWLPAPPAANVRITPIGWFELDASADTPDLALRVAAPTPQEALAALGGDWRPAVQLDGDAALAADVNWLVANLRWDIEADLADAIGPMPAHELMKAGRAIKRALLAAMPASEPSPR